MSEKRFTIYKESKYKEEWYAYPFCIKEDGEVVLETIPLHIAEKVRDKLNEQQATIEYLTKSRDKWRELSNSFLFYCKCYEKAIERAFEEKPCPSEEDINRIYEELEKELDNE